jgi:hypothetical protein
MAAGGRRQQAAADRTVEPVARRQFGRQHAGGEHDQNGASEEQAELDRRKTHRSIRMRGAAENIENSPPMIRLTVAGRHHEAAVRDQAEVVPGNRNRIERRPRRMMGLAQHRAVSDSAEHGKGRDEGEFGTPAESVIERATEQRRESRGRPPSRS